MTRRLIAVLVLSAVLFTGAVGCKSKNPQADETEVPTSTPVSTATVDSTVTPDPDDAGDDAAVSGTSAEAAAIQKELSAIQKELDGMAMPGDTDFDEIEGEIP